MSTLAVKPQAGIVNPSFESRRERCQKAYEGFVRMKEDLALLARKGGTVGKLAKVVSDDIHKLH